MIRPAPHLPMFDHPDLVGEFQQALNEIREMDAKMDAQEKEQGKGGENDQQKT